MPNGHGGIPKYGSPILLVVLLGGWILVVDKENPWYMFRFVLAAVLGWRLAWHIFMYDLMEYGGHYQDKNIINKARTKYSVAAIIFIILICTAVYYL